MNENMLIPSFLLIGDGCPDEQIRNISSERNFTYSFIQTSSIDELSKFLNIIYSGSFPSRKWRNRGNSLDKMVRLLKQNLPMSNLNIINCTITQEELIKKESEICQNLDLEFFKIIRKFNGDTLGGYTKHCYPNDISKDKVTIGPFEHFDKNGLKKGDIPALTMPWKNALMLIWICLQVSVLYKQIEIQNGFLKAKMHVHLDRLPLDNPENSRLQLLQNIIASAAKIPLDRIKVTYTERDSIPDRFIDFIAGWFYEYISNPQSQNSKLWLSVSKDENCENHFIIM